MSSQTHIPLPSSSLANEYTNGQTTSPRSALKPLPFERIDTHSIKQQLHDVLGEDGLPYWKALNGYLQGQLGRGELEGMVKSWFKGDKLDLHNTLLLSLLNNASIPPTLYTPITASSSKKRKAVSYDDPEYDIDEEHIESKSRVQKWIMGINGRERARIRRSVLGKNANDTEEHVELDEGLTTKRASGWGAIHNNMHTTPLALPSRHLPSAAQLSLRLSQYAKTHGLSLASDSSGEVGEFLAVGLDNHLEDILHSVVHLTACNRPGIGTIRIPQKTTPSHNASVGSNGVGLGDVNANESGPGDGTTQQEDRHRPSRNSDIPKANLNGLNHLMTLNPNLHPQISPALYKLHSGQTHPTESDLDKSPRTNESVSSSSTPLTLTNGHNTLSASSSLSQADNQYGYGQSPYQQIGKNRNTTDSNGITSGNGDTSLSQQENQRQNQKMIITGTGARTKADKIQARLLDSGLLRIDNTKTGDEAAAAATTTTTTTTRKDKKHTLHWKYEDPAVLLKDFLG
ncbi:uncharacterized protein I303_105014 [Kwoniella dejecticola CBS 10117]|uniref:Transcriptional coactivator HFI1/ADA1 n=1 Tax=Kwoniella dejecticola CBS 10117 TaxID=1296121 RepID=A0A1A6A3P8_9TREE|nr:uncharacterized protein I303_05540 [Kwoniella dejecticola CBS 10117]OBR84681.1 hypothetical protein I303_05540 [Kwoniella dejecticola CBS 10117]